MSQEKNHEEGTYSQCQVMNSQKSSHSDSSQSHLCTNILHLTPSSSAGVLKPISNNEAILANDKDLPSPNIAELWHKPLKADISRRPQNSITPKENFSLKPTSSGRVTPALRTRRIISPIKLSFDRSADTSISSSGGGKTKRGGYRKSFSMPDSTSSPQNTPNTNPKRLKLFSPHDDINESKEPNAENSSSLTPAVKKLFLKSHSDTTLSSSCSIITALDKIEDNPYLIGDYSKIHILPLKTTGNLHPGLKEITAETLAGLLEQTEEWSNDVNFKIVDCRYPYEFEGGHIKGAVNMYTKTQIKELLLDVKTSYEKALIPENVREILIFHCEFSSKRGPILWRHLRDIDRSASSSCYPYLYYPELYLLFGGYKEFFEKYPTLCEPSGYIPMSDPEFNDSYKRYRSATKLR